MLHDMFAGAIIITVVVAIVGFILIWFGLAFYYVFYEHPDQTYAEGLRSTLRRLMHPSGWDNCAERPGKR